MDSITGQYYLRARYYDPQIGRFTQEDTYRGDGLNLYTYVANNPLKYIDPTGHMKCEKLNAYSAAYNTDKRASTQEYSNMVLLENGYNIWTAFHEIAQLNIAKRLYQMYGEHAELEKKLISNVLNKKGKRTTYEADIVLNGWVWEVKPILGSDPKAKQQLSKYIDAGNLQAGEVLDPITGISVINDIKMKIDFTAPGIAKYSFYKKKGRQVEEVSSREAFNAVLKDILLANMEEHLENGPYPLPIPSPWPSPIPIPVI